MGCNKQQCIFYNESFEDRCERLEEFTRECIENNNKLYYDKNDKIFGKLCECISQDEFNKMVEG